MAITFGPSKTVGCAYGVYQAITTPLGCQLESGGFLICRNGGIVWIVAPNTSEVSRTWHCRNDAVTTATACTNSNTWFVPTRTQLKNPGYTCRTYWDSYFSTVYWSSTECNATLACRVWFTDGFADSLYKTIIHCVRAFRCVTY